MILAPGRSLGRNSSGQHAAAPVAVHVDSLPPVRPWMKMMLRFSVRPRRRKVAGLSSLNHSIDVVGVYNSRAQAWGRRGPVSRRETCAGALRLNLTLLRPEPAADGAHDGAHNGPAIAGLPHQQMNSVASWGYRRLRSQPYSKPRRPIRRRRHGSIERYEDEARSFSLTCKRATVMRIHRARQTCKQVVLWSREGLTESTVAMEVRSSWQTTSTPMALQSTSIPALVRADHGELCALETRLTRSRQQAFNECLRAA